MNVGFPSRAQNTRELNSTPGGEYLIPTSQPLSFSDRKSDSNNVRIPRKDAISHSSPPYARKSIIVWMEKEGEERKIFRNGPQSRTTPGGITLTRFCQRLFPKGIHLPPTVRGDTLRFIRLAEDYLSRGNGLEFFNTP